jgi:hypothetical protein
MEERGRLWNSGVRVVHYGTCDVDTEDGGLWVPMIIHQLRKSKATIYTTTARKEKMAYGCTSFISTKCN